MYSVLIVDDEPLIREGLRTIVDWEEEGFRVADVASDAEEALRKFETLEPRLMIVDIRMPGMDGLELLRTVQERHGKGSRYLILSGYADFEYAREALKMKVEGYLLKPIDEDELVVHLRRVREELDAERRVASEGAADRESAIVRLLSGEEREASGRGSLGLEWASYEIALVKLHGREEGAAAAFSRVKRLLAERLGQASKGEVFPADPYVGLLLKDSSEFRSALPAAYRLVAETCEECGVDFQAAAGGAVSEQAELPSSYERARELMKHRFLFEEGRFAEERPELPPAAEPQEDGSDDERLFLALDAANPEAAGAVLRRMGAAWLAAGASEQGVKAGFVSSLSGALSKLSQSRPELRDHVRSISADAALLYAEYRYGRLTERLDEICSGIAGKLSGAGASPDDQVRKMIELIRRNSADNLKLEALAEALGYNSSYLGKRFKQATGENFNTYLDKVRIGKAKELLRQGKKVYLVAEQVGYPNVDYFHAKFRKYVGSSPIAFRKNPDAPDPSE